MTRVHKKKQPDVPGKFTVYQASKIGERYWWYQARLDWVAQLLRRFKLSVPVFSLDIGCGAGGLVEHLQAYGPARGLDPEAGALDLAQARGMKSAQLFQGRMEELPKTWRNTYDLVTCLDVLEHVPRPAAALQEVRRVLKSGGWFFLTVPGDPKLESSRDARLRHFKRYTPQTLRQELEQAGWEVVRIGWANAFYYWPFRIWLVWSRWRQGKAMPEIKPDTFETTPWLSAVLALVLKLESTWWLRLPLPWGVSVAAVARKPEAPGKFSPYPPGFLFGRGEAKPGALSLTGLKIRRALRALRGVSGAVLELGCGGGQYLRAFRHYRPDLRLTGIDLDPQAADECRAIPGVTALVSNAQALAFKPEAFEAVVGFDILEHVVDPGRVLAEAYRALKPGGVLHLYVPCEGNPGTIYQKRGFAIKRQWGGHVQQFTTANLCALLQKQGFKITRVRHADYSLVQQMDYAFYQKLSHSPNPSAWWAGQALQPGGGWRAWGLRSARRAASALGWLESVLCFGARGAMGAHITAQKDL